MSNTATTQTAIIDWQTKYTAWKATLDELATKPTTTAEQRSSLKQLYKSLMNEITDYMKENGAKLGMSENLEEIGKLQQSIANLYKEKESMKQDVETAVARDESLRTRDIPTNPHALFLLNRPIRRTMIPFLWALGVLFIGITLTVYYATGVRLEIFGTASGYALAKNSSAVTQWTTIVYEFLLSRTVLLTLLGASLLTVLILSLKVGGVF